jgi:hypothetical protein
MFNLFNLDSIVQNRDLLKSFNFSIEDYNNQGFRLLKIEKKVSATPIVFWVNLEFYYPIFFNLLKQPYFPSSISLLTRLGKKVSDSFINSTEEQIKDKTTKIISPWLEDKRVEGTIMRYFRFKNLYFSNRGNIQFKSKEIPEPTPPQIYNNLILRYFKNLVLRGVYEEELYKSVVSIFEMMDGTTISLERTLGSIKVENDKLKFKSLFSVNEDGSYLSVNYGKALADAFSGKQVVFGDLDWFSYCRKKSNNTFVLSPIDLSGVYTDVRRLQIEKATAVRENVLTAEASIDYNKDIPDLVYWNIE